jgi:hypothetical protein
VNDHASTDISSLENYHNNGFIATVDTHLNCGNDPELEKTAFAENSSKGNKDCTSAEVSKDQSIYVKIYPVPIMVRIFVVVSNLMPESC